MRRHGQLWRLAIVAATLGLVIAACNAGTGSKGTIKIALNPWVGYTSNAAVVGYVLENKLGYKVEKQTLSEEINWQGFESGDVQVDLENWGHDDLKAIYIDQKKVAVSAGLTGNQGTIGWYVPPWMVTQYPDIADGANLNRYADLFKTSESHGKGQILDGDPSFVTYDAAIIKNLGLNFEVVYSGSEAALITAFQTAEAQKTPLIGYFYEPQWLFAKLKLVHVKLPPYVAGCDADTANNLCTDYPPYALDKIVSKAFADAHPDAFAMIQKFNWTNDDQNLVSDWITNGNLTPEAAGKQWVDANPDKVKAWLQ